MITSRGYYSRSLVGDFLISWYSILFTRLIKICRYFLIKTWDTFSIGILLSTLFAPWKQDVVRGKNVPLNVQMQFAVWNLISRFIGFIVRFFVILIGLVVWVLILILSGIAVLVYIVLPFGIIVLFFAGIILAVK